MISLCTASIYYAKIEQKVCRTMAIQCQIFIFVSSEKNRLSGFLLNKKIIMWWGETIDLFVLHSSIIFQRLCFLFCFNGTWKKKIKLHGNLLKHGHLLLKQFSGLILRKKNPGWYSPPKKKTFSRAHISFLFAFQISSIALIFSGEGASRD